MSTNERASGRLGSDSRMPIARASARALQAAKEQRRGPAPSVHHVRQMARLSATASAALASSPPKADPAQAQRELESALLKAKRASLSSARPAGGGGSLRPLAARPRTSGAFRPRKLEPTRFRYFYERGDLPVRVNFAGAVRKLQWQVDPSQLDYGHYLPMFMEGLRELDEPYRFLALQGTLELLERGKSRVLPCLPRLVLPVKQNLATRHRTVLCVQMKVLQALVRGCPLAGEALVPYYRQLLPVLNLFVASRVNCGDAIDYAQRRQEDLGDLILETLHLLERHGGPDAFVNIKYMIPTYESIMPRH